MNSLQEAMAAHRAAEGAAVASSHLSNCEVRTLRVEPGGCRCLFLHWSQFIRADYDEKDGNEELVIQFAEDEIVVEGKRLARLFPEVLIARVESLRITPKADLAALKGGDSVIARIQVRARTKPGQSEAKAETF
jgi:hypothetical protein